jgi:hypothetical protein
VSAVAAVACPGLLVVWAAAAGTWVWARVSAAYLALLIAVTLAYADPGLLGIHSLSVTHTLGIARHCLLYGTPLALAALVLGLTAFRKGTAPTA